MFEKVKKVIEKDIRPALVMEGGDIELLSVENGIVKVMLRGACAGCPMGQYTLVNFVESTLKERMPEVKKVEAMVNEMITKEDFSIDNFVMKMQSPEVGAIVSYIGIVRDENNKVEGMKIKVSDDIAKEIESLKEDALKNFDIKRVEILLRKGSLKIGDKILVILVGAEHREDAFRACEYLIDKLKVCKGIKIKEERKRYA